MSAIPKNQVGLVGCHELVARMICRCAVFADVAEAPRVEFLGVRIEGWVGVDGVARDFDDDARGDIWGVLGWCATST